MRLGQKLKSELSELMKTVISEQWKKHKNDQLCSIL